MKEGTLGRRGLLLQGGREAIGTLTRVQGLQAVLTGGTDITDTITKKEDTADTIGQDQGQAHTEDTETETATPDRLADDMYTSPTQLIISRKINPSVSLNCQSSQAVSSCPVYPPTQLRAGIHRNNSLYLSQIQRMDSN